MQKKSTNVRLKKQIISTAIILSCICTVGYIIYLTGGTSNAFTHFMYIPILLSAFYFAEKGAITSALLCGFILGPWMPANVAEGIMQSTVNWIFRTVIFLVIGMITALLFGHIKRIKKNEFEQSFVNAITGQPNDKKLKSDLTDLINNKTNFSLLGFRVTNIDDVNRYADYEIGVKSMLKAIDLLEEYVNSTAYSIFFNEFAVVIPLRKNIDPYLIGIEFLNELEKPFMIDKFKIELSLRGGIVNYPLDAQDNSDLIKKMGIALGQKADASPIIVYDSSLEQKNKERYELSISLFEAIKNEEFYLVYQPQLCLENNSITRVEALLRWTHPSRVYKSGNIH